MICEPVNIDGSVDVKLCSKCGEVKTLSEFHKQSKGKHGRMPRCIQCSKEDKKEAALKPKNIPLEKACLNCKEIKLATKFSVDNMRSDGLQAVCKDCSSDYMARKKTLIKTTVESKTCNVCLIVQPASEFAKWGYSSDGLTTRCKSCKKIYALEYKNKPKEEVEFKQCSECGEIKESSKFNKDSYSSDLLRSRCKECMKNYNAGHYKNNPEIAQASRAQRRAQKLLATPSWFDDQCKKLERKIHKERLALTEATGLEYHVDHIHPLQGENFSGLHVPWNWQVIVGMENLSKKNKPPLDEIDLFFHFTMKELEAEYGPK